MTKISPSVLTADFLTLSDDLIKLENAGVDGLRALGDSVKEKLPCSFVALADVADGKVTFITMATKDAVAKGIHAGNIIREMAKIAGGGGGGRPDSAQAGGKDASKADAALEKALELAKELNCTEFLQELILYLTVREN